MHSYSTCYSGAYGYASYSILCSRMYTLYVTPQHHINRDIVFTKVLAEDHDINLSVPSINVTKKQTIIMNIYNMWIYFLCYGDQCKLRAND